MVSANQASPVLLCYRQKPSASASTLLQQHKTLKVSGTAGPVNLIDVHSGAGDQCSVQFDHTHYYSHLPQQVELGSTLLAASQLQSTQTLLQDNTAILPDNTVCIAYKQVGGKGRGGNKWESPAGCLMFSLLKRVSITGANIPFVQYIATLAIVHAVQQLAKVRLQGHSIDIKIKWPNDVYSRNLKIGGILCHSTYRSKEFQVVIGVGLNLDNSEPTTCVNDLLRQRHEELQLQSGLQAISREELLASILTNIQGLLSTLTAQGFDPLQEEYLQAWLHTDQKVTLLEDGNKEVALTIKGLTEYGYLLAVDTQGTAFALHPDGNSLDFFKGLVRHKLSS
ncbi:hypothetical protein WJX77_009698 [Trebouxia sp. C0004]